MNEWIRLFADNCSNYGTVYNKCTTNRTETDREYKQKSTTNATFCLSVCSSAFPSPAVLVIISWKVNVVINGYTVNQEFVFKKNQTYAKSLKEQTLFVLGASENTEHFGEIWGNFLTISPTNQTSKNQRFVPQIVIYSSLHTGCLHIRCSNSSCKL